MVLLSEKYFVIGIESSRVLFERIACENYTVFIPQALGVLTFTREGRFFPF